MKLPMPTCWTPLMIRTCRTAAPLLLHEIFCCKSPALSNVLFFTVFDVSSVCLLIQSCSFFAFYDFELISDFALMVRNWRLQTGEQPGDDWSDSGFSRGAKAPISGKIWLQFSLGAKPQFWQNLARFRLYRHRSLQVNTRFSTFFEIYKII